MKRTYVDDHGYPLIWTERVRVRPHAHKPEAWSSVVREAFYLLCLVVVVIALTAVDW